MYYKKAKRNRYQPAPIVTYRADDVWAAAAAAQRINGEYVRLGLEYVLDNKETHKKVSNRHIMQECMDNPDMVTEQDREEGAEVRRYYQSLTFKVIQGGFLSEFNTNAMKVSAKEEVRQGYDFNLIASLPSCMKRAKANDRIANRIAFEAAGVIGKIGDKISVELEVLKSVFSATWGIYYITGMTEENNVVFFGHKSPVEVGSNIKATGRIKAHRDNSTQLNRVKIG